MSADHCPDHIERLDLCPQCQAPTVTRMQRLPDVTDFKVWDTDGQLLGHGAPAVLYIGPVEPCPNAAALEEGAANDV